MSIAGAAIAGHAVAAGIPATEVVDFSVDDSEVELELLVSLDRRTITCDLVALELMGSLSDREILGGG